MANYWLNTIFTFIQKKKEKFFLMLLEASFLKEKSQLIQGKIFFAYKTVIYWLSLYYPGFLKISALLTKHSSRTGSVVHAGNFQMHIRISIPHNIHSYFWHKMYCLDLSIRYELKCVMNENRKRLKPKRLHDYKLMEKRLND